MSTFFSQVKYTFPPIPEDSNILIIPFLQAAECILPFFDILGTAFKIVKNDIDGNISRLKKFQSTDPQKYITFRDILDYEIEKKLSRNNDSATKGLLWLKRALEYLLILMKKIVEDHRAGDKTENLVAFCSEAYENSLKPYHGWMVSKVIGMISHAIPWRKDILKSLANGKENMEDEVIGDMENYVHGLEQNVQNLKKMFIDLDCDFPEKV